MKISIFWIATFVLLGIAPMSGAKQTEPGQETVWDDIMASQAAREMREGSRAMEDRRYDRATEQFAKAVIEQPNEPLPHVMLGMAYYWSGQVDQAESEFRQALRLDPKSDQANLLMGIVQAWRGDAKSAYRYFSAAESLNHDRADIQMDLGSIEESLGMISQALDHLRRAVALEPDNALYHFQLGTLYDRLGRDSDEIDSLNLALRHSPGFEDALLELGAALDRAGRSKEALEAFDKAVRLKPRDSVARLRLAQEHFLSGDAAGARAILRDAFHLTPEEAGGGLALSVSFGGKAKAASGEGSSQNPEASKEAPASGGSPQPQDPLDVLARNLQRIPLNQEAKLSIQMVFLPKPKLERAKTHEMSSQLKRALAQAEKPGQVGPIGIRREFTLPASTMADRQAAIDKLLNDLRSAMRQAPPDAEARMAMNLSFSKKASPGGLPAGDSEDAKVSYQPRQVGNDMGLWVQGTAWMALVEKILPEPGEAPSHPSTPEWWVSDGLAYAALGDGGQSLASFDRALALDGKDELALLGRAVALVEMGRESEAVSTYRRLLAAYPKNRTAREGLDWLLRKPVSAPAPAARP